MIRQHERHTGGIYLHARKDELIYDHRRRVYKFDFLLPSSETILQLQNNTFLISRYCNIKGTATTTKLK